jgi:4-oxalocrotonate tautomerase
MPVLIVEMQKGPSLEQKKQLVKDLTQAFVKIGVPAEAVQIIVRETPKNCWAESGELCADFEIPPGA